MLDVRPWFASGFRLVLILRSCAVPNNWTVEWRMGNSLLPHDSLSDPKFCNELSVSSFNGRSSPFFSFISGTTGGNDATWNIETVLWDVMSLSVSKMSRYIHLERLSMWLLIQDVCFDFLSTRDGSC